MFIDLYSFGVFSYIVSLNRVEIKVRVYLICLYGKTKGINSVKIITHLKIERCKVYGYWSTTIYLFGSSRFTGCDLYVVHFLIEK